VLQADGAVESGGTAGLADEYDELWGAGRLSMRVFDSSGMTAPWRFRLAISTIDDMETGQVLLNPDDNGVNQALPADVDTFRAAVWWYEPNLSSGGTAEMQTKATTGGMVSSTYGAVTGQKQRVGVSSTSVLGGYTWTLDIKGLDIPASTDVDYFYGQQKRKVFAVLYWENQT
jgi:hypothetical protein